ncbi:uncharacterized protein LOC144327702 [Podarcis muralis]
MGAHCAPSLACVYMRYFDLEYILSDSNPFRKHLLAYYRYIDDFIFVLDQDIFLEFDIWLNQCDTALRFTGKKSEVSISFLEVELFFVTERNEHVINLHPFCKPTDRNYLLHYHSNHPVQLKNSLPFSQFIRLKRSSSLDTDFKKNAASLSSSLRDRGYLEEITQTAFERAKRTSRQELLVPKPKNNQDRIFCSIEYNYLSSSIERVITSCSTRPLVRAQPDPLLWQSAFCTEFCLMVAINLILIIIIIIIIIIRHWHIISHIPGCENVPILGKRCTRWLRDILSHTDLLEYHNDDPHTTLKGHYRCSHYTCCRFALPVKSFTNTINGRKIVLQQFTNCSTKNCVYCICCACGLLYAGPVQSGLEFMSKGPNYAMLAHMPR